ncbi:unnamed protein product, partial [Urochloa humidicola]
SHCPWSSRRTPVRCTRRLHEATGRWDPAQGACAEVLRAKSGRQGRKEGRGRHRGAHRGRKSGHSPADDAGKAATARSRRGKMRSGHHGSPVGAGVGRKEKVRSTSCVRSTGKIGDARAPASRGAAGKDIARRPGGEATIDSTSTAAAAGTRPPSIRPPPPSILHGCCRFEFRRRRFDVAAVDLSSATTDSIPPAPNQILQPSNRPLSLLI